MFDLDLLKTFVSVVDAGGFTRAGERVHRTQSTISQQIRKLEASIGRPLLLRQRAGKKVTLTEDGELLLGYARRLLTIAEEARDLLSRPEAISIVRLGIPEDFAARRLTSLLSNFAQDYPNVRLDTISGLSAELSQRLAAGELDLALIKREPGDGPCLACWPEPLVWVAGPDLPLDTEQVQLAVFPQGCIYRARAVHALETEGRRWRVAYTSQSLSGVQAAVSSGLGMSILPQDAILTNHRVLNGMDGFVTPPPTELALIAATTHLKPPIRRLAEYIEAAF